MNAPWPKTFPTAPLLGLREYVSSNSLHSLLTIGENATGSTIGFVQTRSFNYPTGVVTCDASNTERWGIIVSPSVQNPLLVLTL